jgi:gliding motility-associated-like protein
MLLFFVSSHLPVFSQDVWLQNHFSPSSGCSLSNAEVVNVLINNNSGVIMPSNTINVSYTVDGGALTQQFLSANLMPGASWSFNFSTNANLSACGNHTMKVWVARAGDVNHLNDTLLWTVQNDCPIVPGNVQMSATVCETGNSGTLNLNGWSNGVITDWQYSINGGSTWLGTGQTSSSYSYSNLTQETQYQVLIDGGFCPDAISGIGTISVQPDPIPGILSGGDSLCITSASGMLNLAGASATPLQWESSVNSGASWSSISNTTTTENFAGLTQTTWYRVLVDGGFCPDVYSDTAAVYVEQLTGPGTIAGSNSFCISDATGALTVSGGIGPVSFWESSADLGTTWSNIANQTTSLNYNDLPETTWYRVYTDGGFCPSYYSDTAVIFVQPLPLRPLVNGSDSLCSSNANGSLTLIDVSTSIIQWESSDDNGATWSIIANTTNALNYSGLTQTTWYRALAEGNLCADVYSDTAIIYIEAATFPGTISGSDSLCISSASGALNLSGSIGSVMFWEYSTDDGANWFSISNTTVTENYSNLTQTTWYRAFTQAPVCPGFYSDTAIVFIDTQIVNPGSVQGGDTICNQLVAGVLTLTGYSGTITHWESSTDNGSNWAVIANTTDVLNCPLVTQTTWYRVFVDGLICSGGYSDTSYIVIDANTVAGTLNQDDQVCAGDSIQLQLIGYTGTSLQWESSPDGIGWSTVSGQSTATYTATNLTSNVFYQVIVQNGVCLPATTNMVELTVVPLPLADAGTDANIVLGDSIQLSGSGGVVGVWTPGTTLSDPMISNPLATPLVTTIYTYTVMDVNGCMASDDVLITVVNPTDFDIKNVITANEDGFNDTWIIEGVEFYPLTSVVVFNVYGKEVYKSDDYQNTWDGEYNDKRLPNGTYYYSVTPGGTDSKLKGTLTILGDE